MMHSLDIVTRQGDPHKPLAVFAHGLGMAHDIWTCPDEARLLGGLAPFRAALGEYAPPLRTLWHDLTEAGYPALAWTQSRPVGPAGAAVEECLAVIERAREVPHEGIVLIGHSRGGLILRATLPLLPIDLRREVRALVTLGSPHEGTTLAHWAGYLRPLASALAARLGSGEDKGRLHRAVLRAARFIESPAVRELLPGSDFLLSLDPAAHAGLLSISAGGLDPRLIRLRGRLRIAETLHSIIPPGLLPEELRDGEGDGLVSARSARLPGAGGHIDFPLNHAELAIDPGVRRAVAERLGAG